jgi:hypothetical protein
MEVYNGGVVGGRSGEATGIGGGAGSHGCQGGFQRVDREFLCTLCVVL